MCFHLVLSRYSLLRTEIFLVRTSVLLAAYAGKKCFWRCFVSSHVSLEFLISIILTTKLVKRSEILAQVRINLNGNAFFSGAGGLIFKSRAGQIGYSVAICRSSGHRCDISSKATEWPRYNEAKMGPANSLHTLAKYSEYNKRFSFDLIQTFGILVKFKQPYGLQVFKITKF